MTVRTRDRLSLLLAGTVAVGIALGWLPALRAQPPPTAIDLRQVVVDGGSPADLADWPPTVTITRVTMAPGLDGGLSLETAAPIPERWKWPSNPAVPSENYQYTVWPIVFVDGRWHGAGIVQMWQGRASTGSGWLGFWRSWVYDDRWGAMLNYYPAAGDRVGLVLSAGNARGRGDVSSVRERSNLVEFRVPPNDVGTFTFGVPVPPPPPPPLPPADDVAARLTALEHRARVEDLAGVIQTLSTTQADHAAAIAALTARPVVAHCRGAVRVFGVSVSVRDCELVP